MASIFDKTQYPALNRIMSTPMLPKASQGSNRGVISAGLSSGVDQLQALGGAALSAAGKISGIQTLEDIGTGIAERNQQEAARNGRPDLESIPTDDLTKIPAWLGYQTAKQIPNIATILLASRLPGIRNAGALLPQGAARVGATAPTWLGGAGLRAGMTMAEQRAALATGSSLANRVASATAASYPLAVGSMYQEAMNRGDPTPGDALKAAALGVPYAALEAFQPAQLERFVTAGLKGSIGKRIATGMAAGAAVEAPVEAAQTALEMSFRPDLSINDKMARIVEAAVTGGAVGGVLGGVGGIRKLKTVEPNAVADEDLANSIDGALDRGKDQQTLPGIAPPAAASQVYDNQTRQLRPLASVPYQELQRGLTELEQRASPQGRDFANLFGEQPEAKDSMLLKEQIRQEMALREAEGGQQEALPSQQLSMDLVDGNGQPLGIQRAPSFAEQTNTEVIDDNVVKAREFATSLLGESKIAQEFVSRINAEDEVGVTRQIIDEINRYDEEGRNLPKPLMNAAYELGLFDEQGRERDIVAERDQARARSELLWRRANETGVGVAEATAFQNKILKPLEATASRLLAAITPVPAKDMAQGDMRDRFARGSAPQSAGDSQQGDTRDRFARGPNPQAAADAQRGDMRDRFARGSEPQPTRVAPGSMRDRFARGSQPQAAEDQQQGDARDSYLRGRVPIPAMDLQPGDMRSQLVNPSPRPAQDAQQGDARDRFARGSQAQAAEDARQGDARDRFARGPAPQAATDIQPGSMRDRMVQQLRNAKLQRMANDQSIGPDLSRAASEALAGLNSFAPNAETTANQVLAEYAERTGDYAFSVKPGVSTVPALNEQDFNSAFERATRKLPAAARNAIVVVDTIADLPPNVARAATKHGLSMDDVQGAVFDGNVYIIRDRVSSAEALQELVNHEVFGHAAARAVFGDQRNYVFLGAFRLAGGLEGLRSIARAYGVEKLLNQYLTGEDLTEKQQIALVDELLAQVAGKNTGKFQMMLLSWASRFKRGLIKVLRSAGLTTAADRMETFDAADLAFMLTEMRQGLMSGATYNGQNLAEEDDVAFKLRTPQGMTQSAQNIMTSMANVERLMQSGTWKERSLDMNRFHLYTSSAGHIVDYFGSLFVDKDGVNWLERWRDANRARGNTEQRLAHLSKKVYSMYEEVLQKNKAEADKIGKLMGYTFYEIDPRKTWDQQTWLHDQRNADKLRQHVAEANQIYRSLVQSDRAVPNRDKVTALKVYSDFINLNEAYHYAQQAVSLYNIIAGDEAVPPSEKAKLENPMDKFLGDPDTYDSPSASRAFWLNETNKLVTAATNYLSESRGLQDIADAATRDKLVNSADAINKRVMSIRLEQEAMGRAPYFHIGRFGDLVLSFDIKKGDNGRVDEAALERIASEMEKAGVVGIEIPRDATRANAFLRFESRDQLDAAKAVAMKLQEQGVTSAVKSYTRKDEIAEAEINLSRASEWQKRLIESISNTEFGGNLKLAGADSKVIDSINGEFNRHIRQFFLNLLPDTAVNKVMVHRSYVPGFSSDMIRSYVFRTQVGGRALANLYASAKMAEATKNMTAITRDARSDADTQTAMLKQNVITELFKREAQRPFMVENTFIDTWRAVNHAFFLGMSPSYILVNMTQIPVLLWPELSKRHGFVGAAKAIGKVTPMAMKIMRATLAEGKKLGWKNLPDASITKEVLKAAGVKGPQADFIMRVVNSGVIDIGSQSRELGRVVEGKHDSKTEQALRWASAAGYYSEMTSRLVAALAAKELHGGNGDDMYKYVDESVRQSMLSYETWNQARATGRMGLAGQYTPIMTSFMQYTFQLTEKLFREFHTAFVNGATTKEEKKAARNFLGAHLAAITVLAGSLGMPMATVFARVIDSMVDLLGDDDEPYNFIASYRNFLAGIFGNDVAEVIARGVPRAFGFDISERVGEQNLIPYLHSFSKLLTDRRTWEDASEDWALNTLGSPVSMVSSILIGGEKVMQGRVLEGMRQMVPSALKGPVEAYKLSTRGYTDTKGNEMPMTPSVAAIMWQAMGFNPALKAEYNEARGVQTTLRGDMIRKANVLRNDLINALESGDQATARDLIREVQRFDEANPEFKIMPRLNAAIKARRTERVRAKETSTPLGTKPGLADRTSFANIE